MKHAKGHAFFMGPCLVSAIDIQRVRVFVRSSLRVERAALLMCLCLFVTGIESSECVCPYVCTQAVCIVVCVGVDRVAKER